MKARIVLAVKTTDQTIIIRNVIPIVRFLNKLDALSIQPVVARRILISIALVIDLLSIKVIS
ncbi:MAG: hypothetical protein CL789_03480 [Chloroflexi bacterium]|nr:hypothetical protein [Chloroflexota bacterium]|tara:strand:- start:1609 stop:1794 length:186 start_codon:yes stop_codon:yes gene_type:complete